jgi:hypothetical protein
LLYIYASKAYRVKMTVQLGLVAIAGLTRMNHCIDAQWERSLIKHLCGFMSVKPLSYALYAYTKWRHMHICTNSTNVKIPLFFIHHYIYMHQKHIESKWALYTHQVTWRSRVASMTVKNACRVTLQNMHSGGLGSLLWPPNLHVEWPLKTCILAV